VEIDQGHGLSLPEEDCRSRNWVAHEASLARPKASGHPALPGGKSCVGGGAHAAPLRKTAAAAAPSELMNLPCIRTHATLAEARVRARTGPPLQRAAHPASAISLATAICHLLEALSAQANGLQSPRWQPRHPGPAGHRRRLEPAEMANAEPRMQGGGRPGLNSTSQPRQPAATPISGRPATLSQRGRQPSLSPQSGRW